MLTKRPWRCGSWRAFGVGTALLLSGVWPACALDRDDAPCHSAGVDAERRLDLPPGLLLAIGRVESGRWDPALGRVTAWPWAINAGGIGRLFDTLGEALTEVRGLQGRGITSVDVGCFQINLFHHPTAFASLEQAFDPQANAAYAAQFLSSLHSRTGSWEKAVAAYHSSNPARGDAYRDQVLAGVQKRIALPTAPAITVQPVATWRPVVSAGGVQVWALSPQGAAFRSVSIPIPSGRPDGYVLTLPTSAKRSNFVR